MATPRIARSKSGADLLFDKLKQEQFQHEERAAIEYLNEQLDISIPYDIPLHPELKDGVLLCNLVNKLKPGTIKQVGQRDLSFIKMDNITRFLQGARQLGLSSAQLFETNDLFEAKDMTAVIHTILAISQLTEKQILAARARYDHDGDEDGHKNAGHYQENNYRFSQSGASSVNKRISSINRKDSRNNGKSATRDKDDSENENNSDEDDDEKAHVKYRDVRDIFGGFNVVGSPNPLPETRLRLNRDALVASRKIGLRATYTAPSHKKVSRHPHDEDEEDESDSLHRGGSRTTPSSPTQTSFSRPPKSPLRMPPRYEDNQERNMARSSSITSVNSSASTMYHQNKQNKSSFPSRKLSNNKLHHSLIASNSYDPHMIVEEQEQLHDSNDRKQHRRLSSPAERTKRQSHTFPNRANISANGKKRIASHDMKEADDSQTAVMGGSLGHKLDRQYRETADEIMKKKPEEDLDKDEKLLLLEKDGQTSTQYQLGNCIGKGQFGSVYRALDLATGEIVAVKRLFLEDGEVDQEMMKEVALLKTLSHSNVIRYLGFIQREHSINIILEFAENGSLMSTLKAFGAFPEKLVASFCIKILSGLEYLHQNEVVHCDLKAANILTTKTGDVKLTDFGVSLNLKIKGADAGTVSGTPNWMAPEVIELKGASTKSDIWSLGCTLIELVTGKPPYFDMLAMSAMFRIVEDDLPPLPDNISQDMQDFLTCCFQKDPESRPSATELKQHVWILQNQQRMRKTETYSHDLSSYLRNHPKPGKGNADNSDDDDEDEEYNANDGPDSITEEYDSNTTIKTNSGPLQDDDCVLDSHNPNESQMTLYDDDDDAESAVERLKVPIGLRDEEDYITHRFIHTSFGKVVECKVCGDIMKAQSIFCEVCALICHEECKKSAFSCPPKVNEQQPSYDWVFSAKVYNKGRKSHDLRSSLSSGNSIRRTSISSPISPQSQKRLQPELVELKPEDAESIRQYALALGLTPQEEQALNGNQALLSHTLLLQQQHKIDPGTLRHKVMSSKPFNKGDDKKKKSHMQGRRQSEECVIS